MVLGACTDVYLKVPPPPPRASAPSTVTVSGSFCTDDPKALVAPVKIVFALDFSQSMVVSDPESTRGEAVAQVVERLGASDALSYAIVLFRGDVNVLTKTANPDGTVRDGFEPSTQLDPAALRLRLHVGLPAPENVDQQTTDFVGALARVRGLIEDDILRAQADPDQLRRTRYVVVFLSDGIPSRNYPAGCQPGATGASACPACLPSLVSEVLKIIRLVDLGAGVVRVNTAYVFNNPDVPPPPVPVHRAAAGLLECMARAGGGDFRDFSLGEPVDFLGFDYATLQRLYTVKRLLLVNRNARVGTFAPDSDGDGLSDADEKLIGTDPTKADTDSDGYSDLLEARFPGNFHPTVPDLGCPPQERGDRDGDGLADCEERFVGTSELKYDTDRDGVPDGVEWVAGTRPSADDMLDDDDHDGLSNGDELQAHTDPEQADVADLSDLAQRVVLTSRGSPVDGRSCFDYRFENVHLAPTLDVGHGVGMNTLDVLLAEVPLDAPAAQPLGKRARATARLVGSVREPAGGEVKVEDGAFAVPPPVPAVPPVGP